MAKTLEEIKKMNIPEGAIIEVKLNYQKSYNHPVFDVGYFQGIYTNRMQSGYEEEGIILVPRISNKEIKEEWSLSDIRDLRNIEEITIK